MNLFKQEWDKIEATPPPHYLNDIHVMNFIEFEKRTTYQEPRFVKKMVESIYAGDCYILKNVFNPDFLVALKEDVYKHFKNVPEQRLKMDSLIPDHHISTKEPIGPKTGYISLEESYHFFRWNADILGIYYNVDKQWQSIKEFSGDRFAFIENVPLNGIVDRIRISNYKKNWGFISTHSDYGTNQKVLFGTTMTERGKDYISGGAYLVKKDDKEIEIEQFADLGDSTINYPTLYHGCHIPKTIDGKKNWNSMEGRWFMALFSVDSHLKQNRRYAIAKKWVKH